MNPPTLVRSAKELRPQQKLRQCPRSPTRLAIRAVRPGAVLVIVLAAACSSERTQDVREQFLVPPGEAIVYTLTVPEAAIVELRWNSVNRNTSGDLVGAGFRAATGGTSRVGAADDTPGDVDVALEGPGVRQTWPRSISSSTTFRIPAAGARYSVTFANGFSLVSGKEVQLEAEIRYLGDGR